MKGENVWRVWAHAERPGTESSRRRVRPHRRPSGLGRAGISPSSPAPKKDISGAQRLSEGNRVGARRAYGVAFFLQVVSACRIPDSARRSPPALAPKGSLLDSAASRSGEKYAGQYKSRSESTSGSQCRACDGQGAKACARELWQMTLSQNRSPILGTGGPAQNVEDRGIDVVGNAVDTFPSALQHGIIPDLTACRGANAVSNLESCRDSVRQASGSGTGKPVRSKQLGKDTWGLKNIVVGRLKAYNERCRKRARKRRRHDQAGEVPAQRGLKPFSTSSITQARRKMMATATAVSSGAMTLIFPGSDATGYTVGV